MKISIIIATSNRSRNLIKALDSLLIQDFSGDFIHDIIVIDNNSTDDTKAVVHSYENKFTGKMLRYLFEPRQGKSFALNTAIKATKADIIIFLDDDIILHSDWLFEMHKFIQNYNFDAATGRVLPEYPPNAPKWVKDNIDILSGPVVSYDYDREVKRYDGKMMNPLIGANMIVKRQLFDEAGYFDTNLGPGAGTFGDDTEMSIRWEKKNKLLYYVGTAAVWHPAISERMTLRYIARWNKSYGKYCVVKVKGVVGQDIICFAGIPRYLLRKTLEHSVKLVFSLFNRRSFLVHWVSLFREIGMAKTYREYYLSGLKGLSL